MSKKASLALALLALLAALIPCAFAQTVVTGDVAGSVTDQTGAVVPDASLTLKSMATGETKTATTGRTGDFRFALLRPGTYTLSATAKGFATTEKQISVDLGQVQNIKMQLGVQGQAQVVEVSEAVELLQAENANLATTYNQAQLQNLPSPGNDMTNYAMFSPGVTVSTGAGYGNYSAFGLPGDSNLYTVNGLDMNDPFNNLNNSGSSNMMLGSNEISEVAVVLNGYTGQYGRQAGAQLNYATKTGTNQFHGNLNWQWNGRVMNANDWFNNANSTDRPFDVSNMWSDSFGGPLIKDKLFFFFNNEGARYVLPGGGPIYMPTSDFSAAVLANLKATNPAAVPLFTQGLNVYAGASGAGRARPFTQADDVALGCGDLVTLNAAGTKALTSAAGAFGITKPCAQVFQDTANSLNKEWLQSERVDYNINANHKIFLRFWSDRGVQATSTDAINTAFSANSIQPSDNGQFGLTSSFGPKMVNQLIASGFYYSAIFGPPNLPAAYAVFPTNWLFADGAPFSNLGGGGNQGNTDYNYPQGRNVRTRQLIDDFAITTGVHTVKFGVNVRKIGWTDFGAQTGSSGLFTFNSMTDFYNGSLGNGSTYSQSFINSGATGLTSYSLGFYGQDEWRVNKKLSVTIAIRMDRNSNIHCVNSACFNELSTPFGPALHSANIPYNTSIQTNVKNAFPSIDAIVPQPRVGFAYSLDEKTVIRGGVGIFSDLYQPLIATRFEQNLPSNPNFTVSSGLIAPGNAKSAEAAAAASYSAFSSGFSSGATVGSLLASVPGFAPPNYNTIAPNINNPIYYEWNLEIQRALSHDVTLSVNYVGNHGTDEYLENLYQNGYAANGFGGLPTTVPDSRFGEIREVYNNGVSYYDGLVASLRWHVGSQFNGSFAYTWSHSLDTCSNGCLEPFNALAAPSLRYQVSPNLGLNYSNSDYDIRHSLNANYVYSPKIPFSNPVAKAVLGGWSVAGTVLYHSGYPFSVLDSAVRSAQGVKNLSGIATNSFIADWVGGGNGYPSCTTPNQACYNAKAQFLTSSTQTNFGNIPRNSFRGPGYFDTDMNVHKVFTVRERFNLLIGVYAYNLFNHPNFDLPFNNIASSGTFGNILETVSAPNSPYGNFQGSSVSGRVLQTQVKFSF
jgi:hypothetical protein